MKTYLEQVVDFLLHRYGVEVVLQDSIEDGIEIAELQHKKILVNKTSRDELGILFVTAHLFGHMVQFSNYEKYRYMVEKVDEPKPLKLSEEFRTAFYAYETEAYGIGKGLLEAVLGVELVSYLDEKYQIYLDIDFEIFWEYLTTDHQITVPEFNALLQKSYLSLSGAYPNPLVSIVLPETINFASTGVRIY